MKLSAITTVRYLSVLALGLGISFSASADRLDHYKGKPSATLAEAVANFTEGNQQLAVLIEGEISNANLAAIHELTYTLENALEKINAELGELAETLEAVHVASEVVDRDTVKAQGQHYLSVAETLKGLDK